MPVTRAKWMRNPEGGNPNTIEADFDGETLYVPADVNNRHFTEIKNAEFRREIIIEDPDPEPIDPYPNLTPRQFEWMLAYYSLEDVWAAVQADTKANRADPVNRNLYANLRGQEKAGSYILEDTLGLMQQVRDRPQIANSGLDLSDDAIMRYWRHAAVQEFTSLTSVAPEPTPPEGETE